MDPRKFFFLFMISTLSIGKTVSSDNCSFEKCVKGKEFCNTLSYKMHCETCDLIPDYCQHPEKLEQCLLVTCKDQETKKLEENFKDKMANKSKEITILKSKIKEQNEIIEETQRELTKRNQTEMRMKQEFMDKIADLEQKLDISEGKVRKKEEELDSERRTKKNYEIGVVVLLVVIAFLIVGCFVLRRCDRISFIEKVNCRGRGRSEEEITPLNADKYNTENRTMDEESCNQLDKENFQNLEREIKINPDRIGMDKQTEVKQPSTLPSYPSPLLYPYTQQIEPAQPTVPCMPKEPPQITNETHQSAPQHIPICDERRGQPVDTPPRTLHCHNYFAGDYTTYQGSTIGSHLSGSSVGTLNPSINQRTPIISNRDSIETNFTSHIQEQRQNVRGNEAMMPLTREEHRQPIQESEEHQ